MKKLLFLLFLTLNGILMFADPPGPPGPGGDPGTGGGVPVGSPVDDQTIVLLIVAALYGLYKIVMMRRNRTNQETSS